NHGWARRPGRDRGRNHQVTTIKTAVPGVFYRRPSPEEPPYVQEGDTIRPGQTIALIEVMKNFNEVKADQAGTVTRFLVENGDEVSISQDIAELGNLSGQGVDGEHGHSNGRGRRWERGTGERTTAGPGGQPG